MTRNAIVLLAIAGAATLLGGCAETNEVTNTLVITESRTFQVNSTGAFSVGYDLRTINWIALLPADFRAESIEVKALVVEWQPASGSTATGATFQIHSASGPLSTTEAVSLTNAPGSVELHGLKIPGGLSTGQLLAESLYFYLAGYNGSIERMSVEGTVNGGRYVGTVKLTMELIVTSTNCRAWSSFLVGPPPNPC